MNRRTVFTLILLTLVVQSGVSAQSRAYAKFGASGEALGLYNLHHETEDCKVRQVFDGVVAVVSARKRKSEIRYQFALEGSVGLRVFRVVLGLEDLPDADVRALISRRQRVRLKACRRPGYWAVEEVTRSR